MWKVTRKGLRANLVRFLLTAFAVIIGVAFVTGTMVLTATVQNVFDDLFANIYRNTDVVVRAHERLSSDFGAGLRPNVPAALLDDVRRAPGVAAASGSVQIPYAQIVDTKGKALGQPGQGPPTLGFAWNTEPKLNSFHLVAGSRPPSTDDEVVIDRHSANKAHLEVGDTITILSTRQPKQYQLVGIARFGTADSLAGASAALFTLPEAQRLAGTENQFDSISAAAKSGVSQDQLARNIQAHLASAGLGQYEAITGKAITKENQDELHKQLGFFNVIFTIFAIVALAVGAFIIYNTFSIVVAQRTKELALLRALGASQRQVLTEVVGESFVVGVLASIAGVVAGIGLALVLKALLAAFGVDIPSTGLIVKPNAVIAGLLIGVLITVLVALFPARKAGRVPPMAAIRDVALERPPRKVLRFSIGGSMMLLGIAGMFYALFAHGPLIFLGLGCALVFAGAFVLGPLFSGPVSRVLGAPVVAAKGITGDLARENAIRNPKRTATTAMSLVIGVALVGFFTVFAASAKKTISAAVDNSFKSDYIIQTGFGGNSGLSPRLAQGVSALPVIDTAMSVRTGMAGINGNTTQVYAVDPDVADKLVDFGSSGGSFADLGPDSIAVSKKKASDHHWKLGDTVPVTFVKTGVQPLRISYIFNQNNFGDYYIALPTYEKNFTDQLDFLVLAKLKPGVSPDDGRAAIEPLVKPYPNAKLQDNAQFKADQTNQINQVLGFVYVMLLFALIVALIGIANTLALSIHERTREIGLLRAVGMSRAQVRSAVRWESVIISLLGTVNGLAIGLFFGWSVVRALRDSGFSHFAIAPGMLLIVAGLLAIASVGAAWLPARRAAKLDMLRAISTE